MGYTASIVAAIILDPTIRYVMPCFMAAGIWTALLHRARFSCLIAYGQKAHDFGNRGKNWILYKKSFLKPGIFSTTLHVVLKSKACGQKKGGCPR